MANKKQVNEAPKSNKLVAAGVIGLAVLSGVAGAGLHAVSTEPVQLPGINATDAQIAEAFAKGVESVEPIVINNTETIEVEKIVEVPVDNGNLEVVLNEIFDNNGKVQYLTSDLDDDEVSQIADRVIFINELKALAVAEAEAEIADLVDKEVVNGEEIDEDDVERVRIDDDADEVVVDEIDYDDGDATLLVTGEFEHDDVDYDFEVEVTFKDGLVDDIELISVVEQ